MRYGIVANPCAGKLTIDQKRKILAQVSAMLGPDCVTAGLDTRSADEYRRCAEDLAQEVQVLIVAGGDGTFLDVVNAVDEEVILSYLPLGSGNALRRALHLPRSTTRIARQIREGHDYALDLILCDNRKKAVMASVGIDGRILKQREAYAQEGVTGLRAYARATVKVILEGCDPVDASAVIDDERFDVSRAWSLIVTKIPYYGYGMNICPKARLDDSYLHCLFLKGGMFTAALCVATSFLGGNRVGEYRRGKQIQISTSDPQPLQINGDQEREGKDFTFRILPGALKMRY